MSTTEHPLVEVKELYKRFGDHHVLKGVDLTVEQGSVTTILGGSGSGKSVLVKHIIGLLKPTSGRILFEGQDITNLEGQSRLEVRRRFGMLFQQSALFDSMNVEENIAFPLIEHTKLSRKDIKREVTSKLDLLGLAGIEKRFPSELSGGMRKRVALARAVILNPSVIIFDEPTTGLDPITTVNVDRMIRDTQQKLQVTSIVITHDMASAFRISDCIAMLYDGRIIEQSHPDTFRDSHRAEVQEFLTASSTAAADVAAGGAA